MDAITELVKTLEAATETIAQSATREVKIGQAVEEWLKQAQDKALTEATRETYLECAQTITDIFTSLGGTKCQPPRTKDAGSAGSAADITSGALCAGEIRRHKMPFGKKFRSGAYVNPEAEQEWAGGEFDYDGEPEEVTNYLSDIFDSVRAIETNLQELVNQGDRQVEFLSRLVTLFESAARESRNAQA